MLCSFGTSTEASALAVLSFTCNYCNYNNTNHLHEGINTGICTLVMLDRLIRVWPGFKETLCMISYMDVIVQLHSA